MLFIAMEYVSSPHVCLYSCRISVYMLINNSGHNVHMEIFIAMQA